MNEPEHDSIDPALLGALRADFAPVARVPRERIAQHLSNSVGTLALSHALPNGRASAGGRWLRASVPRLVSSFVIGGLCGAVAYGRLRPAEAPRVVYVERPTASATLPIRAPGASSVAPSTPFEPEPPAIAANPRSAKPGASAAHSGLADLAEQQALLDQARAAFGRSDYPSTLTLLHRHYQRFAKSLLGEERAALEIKALAASGRIAEARSSATRFKAQFPQSLLLPSVNDSLHDNP